MPWTVLRAAERDRQGGISQGQASLEQRTTVALWVALTAVPLCHGAEKELMATPPHTL